MPLVILFIKAPEKGRVKTRLAISLGTDMALSLYRLFVETTLARLASFGPLRITYTPETEGEAIKTWLTDRHEMCPQRGKDLGERMHHSLLHALADGHTTAILIGGDIPDLPLPLIYQAFQALETHDTVFVPTSDGGYCLVGARKGALLAPLFEDMRWSHDAVMSETLKRAKAHDISLRLLSRWHDIDTPRDLLAFVSRHESTADFPALYREAARLIDDGGDCLRDDAHGHAGEDEALHP